MYLNRRVFVMERLFNKPTSAVFNGCTGKLLRTSLSETGVSPITNTLQNLPRKDNVQGHSDASQKYSDADVIKMLQYLIDKIFAEFGGRIFQQTIGIPVGTNCAPLLADLLL